MVSYFFLCPQSGGDEEEDVVHSAEVEEQRRCPQYTVAGEIASHSSAQQSLGTHGALHEDAMAGHELTEIITHKADKDNNCISPTKNNTVPVDNTIGFFSAANPYASHNNTKSSHDNKERGHSEDKERQPSDAFPFVKQKDPPCHATSINSFPVASASGRGSFGSLSKHSSSLSVNPSGEAPSKKLLQLKSNRDRKKVSFFFF